MARGSLAVVKRRLSGIVFLGVIAGLIGLTIALYQKAFTDVVQVTLQASSAGNQLSTPADVKVRGLIVGEVRDISTTGDGAELELALEPDQVDLIPRNVEARLLPKTLFGEKYVELVLPENPSDERLSEGDVITQDRTSTAVETEQVLNDLLPLLQALKPAELSTTLNALSTALRGRGDQLGENLELVDSYLREFNPEIETLGEDFRGLADFADNLEQTTPDIVKLLDDLSAINRNLVDQEQELNTFLTSTTGFAGEMGSFLAENENRLVRLAADSLPVLSVYAKYSPMFPCLAQGLDKQDELISETFGGGQPGLHITLEFTEDQGSYVPGEEPAYQDKRGPNCFGLPNPPKPAPAASFEDGTRDDAGRQDTVAAAANNPVQALAGREGQRAVMGSVIGPVLGMSADEVPDLAYLLFGPMARGTEVGLS
jgi:phospholipid/cholesterol/gamma-HCH transport system substrate-binding protein